MDLVGRSGNKFLFTSDFGSVSVDEITREVVFVDSLVASGEWVADRVQPSSVTFELASAALTNLDIQVLSNSDRMYTIPKAAQAEAKRALEWRKEHKRGGTPVGLNTARTLARGGQIGIRKVRHIAKYFPRHEVDKRAKGYKPGEAGYPSNGRIAWALWGGDAAQRWASAIVERENKREKSLSNDLDLYTSVDFVDIDSFVASAGSEELQDEFFIRLFTNGAGFDRLYRRDVEGVLSVWEDGQWFDLGEGYTSFSSVDADLDEIPYGTPFVHLPLDAEAALVASAFLDERMDEFVFVSELHAEEAALALEALFDLDTEFLDSLTAAGQADGEYTPEERSENASKQARDATGKFVKAGNAIAVKNQGYKRGVVDSVNQDGTVSVTFDDGSKGSVATNQTVPADEAAGIAAKEAAQAPAEPPKMFTGGPIDLSGILGEPRDVFGAPGATLPDGTLPPLTSNDINTLLTDWSGWVAQQRAAFTPLEIPQIDTTADPFEYLLAPNAYNDPYLRKWLDKKKQAPDGGYYYPNRIWYRPDEANVEAMKPASEVKDFRKFKNQDRAAAKNWVWKTYVLGGKKYRRKVYKGGAVAASADKFAPFALTPETSDVPPVYMAVVSPDDSKAVMDLISLIPANSQTTEPVLFARKDGKWVKDDKTLADLKSPTPPPVVVLNNEQLVDVMEQMEPDSKDIPEEQPVQASSTVDEKLAAFIAGDFDVLLAAGGLDRNRGNAERLRRYWTVGPGGLKIRWNTPGDWTRCVRQLSKYLGPRAKGYCALRHKEMTGLWTGDKAHRQMYGRKGKGVFAMSDEMLIASDTVEDTLALKARVAELRNRVMTASGGFQAPAEPMHGARFHIPIVVPEGVETGDGRKFSKDAITMRELPLPLMWQIKTDEGHYGSVVVGRIDSMERTDFGIGNAYGVFDNGEYGKEAERLVRGGFIRGISADLDKFEAEDEASDDDSKLDKKKSSGKIVISKARVMGITLVPKPAFQECSIRIVEEPVDMGSSEQDAMVACASVVASIPVVPPREWFNDPKLAGATPLTVSDDGRVFGHIAAWHVDHIGLSFGTKPPRSRSNYAYFHTGVVRTADGSDVPVGQLTLTGGHASLSADARSAAKHYDDTGSAFADVHAGEDAYGIWVAGSLRPEVTAQQVRAIRASAPSGDWRPIGGNLELVAVCQVNVPGFPIARARVASGEMFALVAAGASYLARLKDDPEFVLKAAEEAKARFASIRSEMASAKESALVAGAGCGCCAGCHGGCKGDCCPMCVMSDMSVEPIFMGSMKALLADVIGFSFRAQGYHWNVVGEDFAQYHKLFGKIYEDVHGSVDPLAENIRKLGGYPPTSLREFADKCSLAGTELDGGSARQLAADLLIANEALVEELKAVFTLMDSANEQGVADFIAGRIDAHQMWSWQLSSSITEKELIISENDDRGAIFEAVFADLENEGLIASSAPYGDFAYISQEIRERAAEKGQALPDGSFPIRNVKDLKNAVRAYGRSKPSKRAEVRKHIIKRAKQLKRPDLIPDTFKDTATVEAQEMSAMKEELATRVRGFSWADKASELSSRFHSLTAAIPAEPMVEDVALIDEAEKSGDVRPKFTPKTQPRDAQGRFRQVLARLKMDLGDASLGRVMEKVEEAENLDNAGNYVAAANAANEVIDVVNRIDSRALDPKALSSVRMGAKALAVAISNLPLPFKDQSQKIRYSDVPPALRDLIDDMITKVEAKIGSEDAKIATEKLEAFRSGSDVFNQSEISSEMNKLLRLLT